MYRNRSVLVSYRVLIVAFLIICNKIVVVLAELCCAVSLLTVLVYSHWYPHFYVVIDVVVLLCVFCLFFCCSCMLNSQHVVLVYAALAVYDFVFSIYFTSYFYKSCSVMCKVMQTIQGILKWCSRHKWLEGHHNQKVDYREYVLDRSHKLSPGIIEYEHLIRIAFQEELSTIKPLNCFC